MILKVKSFNSQRLGFTLIELLVVVAIFGLLISVAFANFRESRVRARNATRLHDLRELQNALGLYHSNNQAFPGVADTSGSVTTELTGLSSGGFIPSLPSDPLRQGATSPYFYCPGSDNNGAQDYVLRTVLEDEGGESPSVLEDDLDGTIYGCSCADANRYFCVGP
jgi:prepilin-type N-terminal cleavage/methylation domain-containing protein